jgi:hypothetical protein
MFYRLSKAFMARSKFFCISKSWMSGGWWAVRRECLISPDLSGVELVDGYLPPVVAKTIGINHDIQCRTLEDEFVEKFLPVGSTEGLERFKRTDWSMVDGFDPKRKLEGVVFQSDSSLQTYFLDREAVEVFDIEEVVVGADDMAMTDLEKRFVVAKRYGCLPRIAVLNDRVYPWEAVEAAIRLVAKHGSLNLDWPQVSFLVTEVTKILEARR